MLGESQILVVVKKTFFVKLLTNGQKPPVQ